MKAMILAAGKGTRLRHLTRNKPKALVEVNGKPLLEILIEKLKREGFDHILINLHHFGRMIKDYVLENNCFGITVEFSDESGKLLDTGGAILKAADFFAGNEPVLIHNVDIFSDIRLKPLIESFGKSNDIARLIVRKRETKRYLLFDENMYLSGWTNKSSGEIKRVKGKPENYNEYAFSGIWMAKPEFVRQIPFTGAFSIINVWLEMAKRHKIKGVVDNSSLWHDLGTPDRIAELERIVKEK